ncbi:MAG: aminoglycoside phosphotransferase family protein [Chloroflexi bacterium]|nr:aminoglycoside phosphotransferase family protein [Chloroflexota bacterium]MQC16655.1 aminoglycoside phosphotransferase family protein [Chloroflexota bacterium]
MSGLESLPDAATVAQIVIAATGESPDDLRIVDQGVTSIGWRIEAPGGPYCVLVGLPPPVVGTEQVQIGPQFEARAALLTALRERDTRCPKVLATSSAPDVPERLRRWPWMVTDWMRGEPLADVSAMTPDLARDVGELLAHLHALPADGYGLLVDAEGASRGVSDDPGDGLTSRWGPELWPFDGRPLAAHSIVQVAPGLVLAVAALREQLLAYAEAGARAICHTDLNPGHVWVEDGRLAGLIDFGDAAVLPPAVDIASFAYSYGWTAVEALLEGYAPNRVLRDIRRAEAYQLGVLLALQRIEKYRRFQIDPARVAHAVSFLDDTLPHAVRRTDA